MSKLFDNDDPLEREIEEYARKKIQAKGGVAYKFTSPARRGVPDRMVVTATGVIHFIEFKRRGKEPTIKQQQEIQLLKKLNQSVFVIDSKEQVDEWVEAYMGHGQVHRDENA